MIYNVQYCISKLISFNDELIVILLEIVSNYIYIYILMLLYYYIRKFAALNINLINLLEIFTDMLITFDVCTSNRIRLWLTSIYMHIYLYMYSRLLDIPYGLSVFINV